MLIRAVTFDCWGTLIADRDMSRSMARRAQAIADASGGHLSMDEARAVMDRAWQVHHDAWVGGAHYGSDGMARFCAEVLGAEDESVVERLCVAFEEASVDGEVFALPGARDALVALREAGIRTALVCDTGFTPGRLVRRFLGEFGFLDHLEFLAFSNEVGVPKPDARIFRAALDAIDTRPEHAVHVGDLRRTDVAGAKAVGMRAIRITAVNDTGTVAGQPGGVAARLAPPRERELPEADVVIGSYDEFLDALRRLGAAV
jgi:putative hydrolase of the HAD superfamily